MTRDKRWVGAWSYRRRDSGKDGASFPREQRNPPTLKPSALRGFPATPDFILQIAPAFRGWVNSAKPTWSEVIEAAFHVRSELKISQHAWGQACIVLGRMEATTAVAAIAAKLDAGLVRSPGGLLRRMVEAHEEGTLRLDRTLFGLADRTGGLRRRTSPANAIVGREVR